MRETEAALISSQLHPWLKIPSFETQKAKLTEDQLSYTENIHMGSLWSSCQFHYQGKVRRCNLPVLWRRLWSVLVMRTHDEVSWELVVGNSTVSFAALASRIPKIRRNMATRGYQVTVLSPITSTSAAFLPDELRFTACWKAQLIRTGICEVMPLDTVGWPFVVSCTSSELQSE